MADLAIGLARELAERVGPVDAVGVAAQRCSTIVWDRATGEPVGPGIGWQDLRTVGECMALGAQGRRVAPNASATKVAWLLNTFDPNGRGTSASARSTAGSCGASPAARCTSPTPPTPP